MQEAGAVTGARQERVDANSVSTRTLVAKKHKGAIFFLAGWEKNAPGTDFSGKEVEAAKIIARVLASTNDETIGAMVMTQTLKEICHDSQKDD